MSGVAPSDDPGMASRSRSDAEDPRNNPSAALVTDATTVLNPTKD